MPTCRRVIVEHRVDLLDSSRLAVRSEKAAAIPLSGSMEDTFTVV